MITWDGISDGGDSTSPTKLYTLGEEVTIMAMQVVSDSRRLK